jgi:hypothetical protein
VEANYQPGRGDYGNWAEWVDKFVETTTDVIGSAFQSKQGVGWDQAETDRQTATALEAGGLVDDSEAVQRALITKIAIAAAGTTLLVGALVFIGAATARQ